MLTLDRVHLAQGDFHLTANWSVAAGARVAIIGPSGAGKSTLLAAIAGFLAPDSGQIRWQGMDLTAQDPGARPISMVFQDHNLFPHLTLAQNVGLGLSPRLRLTADQGRLVTDTLARVGLGGLGLRKPAQVSGGQISRTALARVLVQARPIVLLDEPFAALGPGMKDDMINLLADVATATGALVLMVTHDPDDALRFAPQTVLVADGVVHPPQPTAALLADPPAALRGYLGTRP